MSWDLKKRRTHFRARNLDRHAELVECCVKSRFALLVGFGQGLWERLLSAKLGACPAMIFKDGLLSCRSHDLSVQHNNLMGKY